MDILSTGLKNPWQGLIFLSCRLLLNPWKPLYLDNFLFHLVKLVMPVFNITFQSYHSSKKLLPLFRSSLPLLYEAQLYNLQNVVSGRALQSSSLTFHFTKKMCDVFTAKIFWVSQNADTNIRTHMTCNWELAINVLSFVLMAYEFGDICVLYWALKRLGHTSWIVQ